MTLDSRLIVIISWLDRYEEAKGEMSAETIHLRADALLCDTIRAMASAMNPNSAKLVEEIVQKWEALPREYA